MLYFYNTHLMLELIFAPATLRYFNLRILTAIIYLERFWFDSFEDILFS